MCSGAGRGSLTAARIARKRVECRAVPFSSGAVGHRMVELLSEWSLTWIHMVTGWIHMVTGWIRMVTGWIRMVTGWIRMVELRSEWSLTCLAVLWSRILCCCVSARERVGKASFVVVRYISAGIRTGPMVADCPEAHDWAEPERFM